jgi:hypothetical protein
MAVRSFLSFSRQQKEKVLIKMVSRGADNTKGGNVSIQLISPAASFPVTQADADRQPDRQASNRETETRPRDKEKE